MATADSIIRVSIIGDAKKLQGAVKDADKGLGGLLKGAAVAAGGLIAVDKAFDFAQGAIQEADRLGDAITRLNISIGKTDADKLESIAGNFTDLGLSKQDMLELSANFADLAKNAGIAQPTIAGLADDVAATAAAMSLLDDSDPAGNIDKITKAAKGNAKAMQALGLNISDAEVEAAALAATGKTMASSLTDGEKATARLNLILAGLKPKLDAATSGSADLEQNQRKLQATVESLQAELGGPLSDALNAVLGFILDEVRAIPGAIEGWKSLGKVIEDFARTAVGPLGNVRDALEGILHLLGQTGNLPTTTGAAGRSLNVGTIGRRSSERTTISNIQRVTERRGGIGNSLGGP